MSGDLNARIKAINSMGPWITLDLSASCGLNCIMCRASETDSCSIPFMDPGLFEYLIHDIYASGLRFKGMKLSWLGESTLHPEFPRIIDMISSLPPAEALAIETNLQGMTEEAIKALVDCSLRIPVFITCSLDAVSANTYSKIRVGGDFDAAVNAVKKLREARTGSKGMLYLRYQFVLMPENAHELDNFIDQYDRTGAEGPYFEEQTRLPRDLIYIRHLVDPSRQEIGDKLFHEEKERLNSSKELASAARSHNPFKQHVPGLFKNISYQESSNNIRSSSEYCTKPLTMVFVRPDGTLRYCDQDPSGILGTADVRQGGFTRAWLSGKSNVFISELLATGRACSGHCLNCPAPASEIEDYKIEDYLHPQTNEDQNSVENLSANEDQNSIEEHSSISERFSIDNDSSIDGEPAVNIQTVSEDYSSSADDYSSTIDDSSLNDKSFETQNQFSIELNWSHQNAAALIKDGQLINAIESERIRRIRYYNDLDIEDCEGGISIVKHRPRWSTSVSYVGRESLKKPADFDIMVQADSLMSNDVPFSPHPEHHVAHAACAYWLSGFDRAAVLTVDAVGYPDETATLCLAANDNIRKLASIKLPHSLGRFYILIGNWLGLAPQPEGKTMALSAMGDDRYLDLFRNIVKVEKHGFTLSPDYIESPSVGKRGEIYQPVLTDRFYQEICPPRSKDEPLTEVHYSAARAAQTVLEEAILGLSRWLYELTGEENLCYAGGVALNCVANRRLLDESPFENLFIPPAPDDSGLAAGYALYHHHVTSKRYKLSPNKAFIYLNHARKINDSNLLKSAAIALSDRRKVYRNSAAAITGLMESANAFIDLNMKRRARKALEFALKLGAEDLVVYWKLADVLESLGFNDKALRVCRRSLKHHRNSWEAWHRWGLSLMRKGQFDKSAKVFKKACQLSEDNPLPLFELGCLYLKEKSGKFNDGIQIMRQLAAGNTHSGRACLEIARAMETRKEYREAESWYKRASSETEVKPDALTGLGALFSLNDRFEEAELVLAEAIDAGSGADASFHMARLMEDRGDFKKALLYFENALHINAEHKPSADGKIRVERLIK